MKRKEKAFFPLTRLMKSYGLELTESQLQDIIDTAETVSGELEKIPNKESLCDVSKCNKIYASGGSGWRETGYWNLCYNHSDMARKGEPQPPMKQRAIKREKSRLPNGYLP